MAISVNAAMGLTQLSVPIVASASGVTNLIAAPGAGKTIIVTGFGLMSNGTVNVKFQSHVTPTDLTGLFYLVANTGISVAPNPAGIFSCLVGEALDINLTGAVAVGGFLTYIVFGN